MGSFTYCGGESGDCTDDGRERNNAVSIILTLVRGEQVLLLAKLIFSSLGPDGQVENLGEKQWLLKGWCMHSG